MQNESGADTEIILYVIVCVGQLSADPVGFKDAYGEMMSQGIIETTTENKSHAVGVVAARAIQAREEAIHAEGLAD